MNKKNKKNKLINSYETNHDDLRKRIIVVCRDGASDPDRILPPPGYGNI